MSSPFCNLPCLLVKIIYLYCNYIISFGRTKVKYFFKFFYLFYIFCNKKALQSKRQQD
uniref:Uncharacterized protein n=1 Tax=Myoviridae sp. ctfyA6 TaxID=2827698 RepID=A0A8S5SSN5_9CAUD|nr:MAG TPA: hypothetical protein [Myoviridae sp. ctfyA6]